AAGGLPAHQAPPGPCAGPMVDGARGPLPRPGRSGAARRAAGHRGGRRGDGGRDLAVLLLPARVPVRRVRTPGAERSRCRGPRELPLLPSRSRPGPGPSSLTVAELAELHGLIVEEGKLRAR